MGKYPIFVWSSLDESYFKGVGKIVLNIPQLDLISDTTHIIKSVHKTIFYLAINPKKYNQLVVHVSDSLRLNNYLGWYNKQQKVKYFDEFNKIIKASLQHIFVVCGVK